MKKYVFALFALMLLAGNSCQEKIDIEKEKEAVKAAIESFVNDRSELDYDGYFNAWVDEPYSFISWAGKDGHFFMHLDDYKKQSKEDFASLLQTQKEGGYSITIEPVDLTIKVYKEAAWAHFKNKWTKVYEENEETEDLGETFIILSLEKYNGEWKISYLSAVVSYSYKEAEAETEVETEEIVEGEVEAETEETE